MPLNVPSPLWTQCKEREREREGKVEKRVEVEWRKNRAELDAEEGCVRDKDSRDSWFPDGGGRERREGVCSLRWLDFAQTPIRLSFYEHFARHSCVRVLYRQKLFAKLRSILTPRTPRDTCRVTLFRFGYR